MESEEDDYENLAYVQRLKAAIHYTVGQLCERQGEEMELTYDKQFIAALTETTFRYCESMTQDLELFAKHAKRTTINTDDVKLLVRKTPTLRDHIQNICDQQQVSSLEKKQKKTKKKQTKSTNAAPLVDDDDSN